MVEQNVIIQEQQHLVVQKNGMELPFQVNDMIDVKTGDVGGTVNDTLEVVIKVLILNNGMEQLVEDHGMHICWQSTYGW